MMRFPENDAVVLIINNGNYSGYQVHGSRFRVKKHAGKIGTLPIFSVANKPAS
jgi:hypothetical protein